MGGAREGRLEKLHHDCARYIVGSLSAHCAALVGGNGKTTAELREKVYEGETATCSVFVLPREWAQHVLALTATRETKDEVEGRLPLKQLTSGTPRWVFENIPCEYVRHVLPLR